MLRFPKDKFDFDRGMYATEFSRLRIKRIPQTFSIENVGVFDYHLHDKDTDGDLLGVWYRDQSTGTEVLLIND